MNGHCWSRESQPEIFVSPQAATSQLSNSWENSLFAVSSALAVGTQREKIRFRGLHLFPQATFCPFSRQPGSRPRDGTDLLS